MAEWQERLTHDSPPGVRVEHDVRYRAAAALCGGVTWIDLGCGNGIAAATALREEAIVPSRTVLVDVAEAAAEAARSELGLADATVVVADLQTAEGLARVSEAVLAVPGARTITCFEVVEHLDHPAPLLELLMDLGESEDCTVVLSVPNDAFNAVDNPHHATAWGEGSFDELRRLLPDGHRIAHQIELVGTVVAPPEAPAAGRALEVTVDPVAAVPTHFLASFGPRADELGSPLAVRQADADARRAWDRERDAGMAFYKTAMPAILAERDELRAKVAADSDEFEAWRRYIHELEDQLRIPRSGTAERAAHDTRPQLDTGVG